MWQIQWSLTVRAYVCASPCGVIMHVLPHVLTHACSYMWGGHTWVHMYGVIIYVLSYVSL